MPMKSWFTLSILICIVIGPLQAQQLEQYSLYMLNKFKFNPSYAGLDNSLSITGVIRKQWVGLEGSPAGQLLNFHMPVYLIGGGIGIHIENDLIGAQRNTQASFTYGYHINLGESSILSVGVRGGVIQKSLDGRKLRAPDGVYGPDQNFIDHKDGFLPIGTESSIAPKFAFGLYFINESIEFGVAVNNLLESSFNYQFEVSNDIKLQRSYILNLAYNLNIGSSFTIYPSILIKSDIGQTQVDFSTLVKYNDNIFGGASFRGYNANSIDAVVFIAGLKVSEKLTLAYAYDMTLSSLNLVSTGSHEIMLNYNLNKIIGRGIPPKIIYNPRFL